jgi:hypothetical protein
VRRLRRIVRALFAGDRRVWIGASVVAAPLAGLIAFYCLHPRAYYTGTNSVEAYAYLARTAAGEPLCVPDLHLPARTSAVELTLRSPTRLRPALNMTLLLGARKISSRLEPQRGPPGGVSRAVFAIPETPRRPAEAPVSLCVSAAGFVSWGGTPFASLTGPVSPTVAGRRLAAGIAIWYLPRPGARLSYVARSGEILRRASLFRTGLVGPWLFVVILLVVLPLLALASVRLLAVAVGGGDRQRWVGRLRPGALLFVIAALNFACWAFITPLFQSPDEVDHFAYTQSLVERGAAPSRNPLSPLKRWSSAEQLLLNNMSFFSDRQVGDSRPPWTERQQDVYRRRARLLRPSPANGGGYETAATHGAIYYAALAPAYLIASSSPLDQLTLMRLLSALIGALTVLFAYLLARELAPGRPWLAVLAALLVAFQPMYGSISGAVDNDVGINAGAAALELVLIMIVRRGITVRLGLILGALLLGLPVVKGTVYSLYPVVLIVLLATLWRNHRRTDIPAWTALAAGAGVVGTLSRGLSPALHPPGAPTPKAYGGTEFVANAVTGALAHPLDYLAYVWQVFLPRLSFMAPHFEATGNPAFVIVVERGWAAFGWYDVLFPGWVYVVILIAMLATPALGVVTIRRETAFVSRNIFELCVLVLMPLAVLLGVEAAFYLSEPRTLVSEYGRYFFPAIAPLAVLVVASLHAFGRRWIVFAGAGLLATVLALSYASQLLTLTTFYA